MRGSARLGRGGFRDTSSSIFGGGGGRPDQMQRPEAGTDLEYQVNVSFWQAIKGAELQLSIPHLETCSNCHGQGYIEQPGECPQCHGKGTITQKSGSMKFEVPCPRCGGSGKNRTVCPVAMARREFSATNPSRFESRRARAMDSVFASGRGNAGTMGGSAGDLYIIVRVGEHPVFKRDADDIHLTVPVTLTEAALGAKVEVPTIDGRALLRIPPGTQSGQKLPSP